MENNIQYDLTQIEYHPEVIENETFTKKETVLAFLTLPLGFAFIKLLLAPMLSVGSIGLGAAVFMLMLTVFCVLCSAQCNHISMKSAFRFALCVLFSANVFISSDIIIQFLDIVFVFLVIAYDRLAASEERFSKIRKLFPADIFSSTVILPFAEFDSAPKAIKQQTGKSDAGKAVKNSILGLAIAIPSTVVVGILLMLADDGFKDIMENILNDGFTKVIIAVIQLIFGIPAGFYFFGMCRSASKKNSSELINDEQTEKMIKSLRFLPSVAATASAVPVCILYVLFFFSQLNYYIASFFSELPVNMTSYSEYARKGFFELCIVSVINLCIIIGINLFSRHNDEKKPLAVKIITCVLSVFTILLIATAVSKMVMYINVFGLTLLRVFTTWFMILLAVVFLGIIISAVNEKFNLSKMAATAFIIMFTALSFCNVDGIIAEYNVNRYLDGTLTEFDMTMTWDLSTGAVPAMSRLLDSESYTEKDALRSRLEDKADDAYTDGINDMRGLTLSDIIAYRCMEE